MKVNVNTFTLYIWGMLHNFNHLFYNNDIMEVWEYYLTSKFNQGQLVRNNVRKRKKGLLTT